MEPGVVVFDVGKTHAKLSLWTREGRVGGLERANVAGLSEGRPALDVDGQRAFLLEGLHAFSRQAELAAIVPVAHGAAAALVADDRLAAPVLDYEAEPPLEVSAAYEAERDGFDVTGSPSLPAGLNLGRQLFWQERLRPELADADVLLWPQFWAWVLSGERASEVTSLGCHTDLWRPRERDFSDLARRRGWADRLGPLRAAGEALGRVRPELAAQLGLPAACEVLCGLHDSNAALLAARAQVGAEPFTVLSTGTWFVAMQSGREAPPQLDPARDTLLNVDVEGRPVPSARVMGGRLHAEQIAGGATTEQADEAAAEWSAELLDLIDAQGLVLVEGRFGDRPGFLAALARLRPAQPMLRAVTDGGVAFGAARLVWPDLAPAPRDGLPLGRASVTNMSHCP